MIPGSANPLLLATAAGAGGYAISRSLRFNSSDSAYLSRTPASAGNRKTWTWAGWVKRSGLAGNHAIFGEWDSSGIQGVALQFLGTDKLRFYDYATSSADWSVDTAQVFRDPSAWYHLVFTVDTTQATASNRIRIYVNGSQATLESTTYPSQNLDTRFNRAQATAIGRGGAWNNYYFPGYLADIHFIDGQALDPTSFGEFDATTGVWVPKAYTGTYGTNGFHLEFADNSSNTATTLGKDTSPNGNNWTPNNLSVTAGAGNDSVVDVPTNGAQTDTGAGGEVRGNYCTLNPLDAVATGTKTNGNLDLTSSHGMGTFFIDSGKWYYEFTPSTVGEWVGWSPYNYASNLANLTAYRSDGTQYNGSGWVAYGATYAVNDVIGIAIDRTANTVQYFKNGVSQGVISRTLSGLTAPISFNPGVANFGQRPFAYTAPSGFKALNTANLPAPVVTKPNEVMDVALWTGNGGNQSITLPGGFNPDLVWVKSRSNSQDHYLFDAIRGGAGILRSNTTGAETTGTTYLSFDTSGFSSLNGLSSNGYTYAGWCWDAGSSTVTNTVGSISSQVRANASAGFSVVTYTGTGAAGTIGHGLGIAPSMIILKNRTSAVFNWLVYHSSRTNGYLPQQNMLFLNSTSVGGTGNNYPWNNTAPTSTVFSIGSGDYGQITSGNSIVAYCWAPVAGYSAMGSYTGNGSTDGPFVYTGFRPRWLLTKRTDSTAAWYLFDSARLGYNPNNELLYPNYSNAEANVQTYDLLSNGFKVRTVGTVNNASGGTYVWAAFAESPFQYARAR